MSSIRSLAVIALLAAASPAAAAQTPLQTQSAGSCTALAPAGWSFTGESPAGSSFGADIMRYDRSALASYYVVGVSAEMRTGWYSRWYATPDNGAIATLSQLGTVPVSCGGPRVIEQGLKLMSCRTPEYVGVALYQAFPIADGGYVLVMRTAAATPGQWSRIAPLASAISRSMRCKVRMRPTSADWTSDPHSPKGGKRKDEEGDPEYSQWLGMENYHDSSTGQNYWVSPSTDWSETGPRGPGYYSNINGEPRLLAPGRVG